MSQCIGRTASFHRCKKPALVGKRYCSAHSKQPLYLTVVVLGTVALGWLAGQLPGCRDQIDRGDLDSVTSSLREGQQAILSILGERFVIDSGHLRTEYPYGYTVFYTDWKDLATPLSEPLSGDLEIDWRGASVRRVEGELLRIVLPDFHYKPKEIVASRNVVHVPRAPGVYAASAITGPGVPLRVFIEIIDSREDLVVGVLGVKENPEFEAENDSRGN